MSRNFFALPFILFFTPFIYAQDFWNEGSITLKNNLSIAGEVSLGNNLDKIKFKSTLYEKTFKISELLAFQYEDYELGINRFFVSNTLDKKSTLFEVIVDGRYPVYREIKDKKLFNKEALLTEVDYNFYVQTENQLVSFKDFDKILKKITWDFPFEIRDFVYKYNLNLKVTAHKVLIMQHYNALTAPNLDHSRVQKLLSIR